MTQATRIRLVADPSFAKGTLEGISRLVECEGPGSIFKGMPAILAKQLPYTIVQLCGFELITWLFYSWDATAAFLHSHKGGMGQWIVSFGSAMITVSCGDTDTSDALLCGVTHRDDVALALWYHRTPTRPDPTLTSPSTPSKPGRVCVAGVAAGGRDPLARQQGPQLAARAGHHEGHCARARRQGPLQGHGALRFSLVGVGLSVSHSRHAPRLCLRLRLCVCICRYTRAHHPNHPNPTSENPYHHHHHPTQRARLLHVGMIVTIQLVIYDFVKQLVGLPATGAH